ncbi:RNA-directed DNA polymerase, eukaryota [Tanacetum coccineum]
MDNKTIKCNRYKTISQTQKEELEGVFGEDEVWNAIKGCGSNKAPGPDGFNFGFIIKCWGVIKADLLKSLEWFWETCSISKGCNPSFVTLIPKTQNPIGLSDYRPISLIGCFYKILAKRIKKVIGGLIGDEQNAFIKGRFILDGSLIANEAFDFLKKKKKRAFLLKIDFEKAYVSVNWKFITDTMGHMGSFKGIFKGVKIGHDDIPVSHLQYADDTLVFGEWSLPNAKNLMRIFNNKAKIKKEIEVLEMINIELEHSVAKLLAENEKLHKENENLKQTYKDLYDSIKRPSSKTKDLDEPALDCSNYIVILFENAELRGAYVRKRNSSKESYGSNDMAHNYYLDEAKKKTQDKNRNLKPREMPSARTHHTPNACTPKPRSYNQTSRNWHASKSCEEM